MKKLLTFAAFTLAVASLQAAAQGASTGGSFNAAGSGYNAAGSGYNSAGSVQNPAAANSAMNPYNTQGSQFNQNSSSMNQGQDDMNQYRRYNSNQTSSTQPQSNSYGMQGTRGYTADANDQQADMRRSDDNLNDDRRNDQLNNDRRNDNTYNRQRDQNNADRNRSEKSDRSWAAADNTNYNNDRTATDRTADAKYSDNEPNAKYQYPQDRFSSDADRVLNMRIREKLAGWFTNSYKNVALNTNNGNVSVSGYVDSESALKDIPDYLNKVDGVKSVNVNVQVRKTSDSR